MKRFNRRGLTSTGISVYDVIELSLERFLLLVQFFYFCVFLFLGSLSDIWLYMQFSPEIKKSLFRDVAKCFDLGGLNMFSI